MSINRYDEELVKPLVPNHVHRHIKYRQFYMICSQIISFFSGMFFSSRAGVSIFVAQACSKNFQEFLFLNPSQLDNA